MMTQSGVGLALLAVLLAVLGPNFALAQGSAVDRDGATSTFAVIGDFGTGDNNEAAVAELVRGWDVDFIITVGDNYYRKAWGKGGNVLNQYDNSVGAFYCPYLAGIGFPESGSLACPPAQQSAAGNRFFPTIGNHDRTDTNQGLDDYLNYFDLPGDGETSSSGNERYYDFIRGPVHFFALDSDTALRDEQDMTQQKAWLEQGLKQSPTPWQVVYFHQPAYSSGEHGSTDLMQWPFASWGADAVFQGHDHNYERILNEGIVYFTSGNGGRRLYKFGPLVEGSAAGYDEGFGALLVMAEEDQITFEAWAFPVSRFGQLSSFPVRVDCYMIPAGRDGCAALPSAALSPENTDLLMGSFPIQEVLFIFLLVLFLTLLLVTVFFLSRKEPG